MADGKKNARRRRAWIVFQDESGVSQRPPVRRTWAPRGETPVLIHAFNWKKLSIAPPWDIRWDFRRSGLFFRRGPGITTPHPDRLPQRPQARISRATSHPRSGMVCRSHKSRPMQAYLRAQRAWLTVERLPGYAPDLNPVELCGAMSKGRNWRTAAPTISPRSSTELRRGLRRVRRSPTLAFSFLRHTGLSF